MRFYLFGNPKADAFKDDRSIKNRGRNINDLDYSLEEVRNFLKIFYFFYLSFVENYWSWLFSCCFCYYCYHNTIITIMAL